MVLRGHTRAIDFNVVLRGHTRAIDFNPSSISCTVMHKIFPFDALRKLLSAQYYRTCLGIYGHFSLLSVIYNPQASISFNSDLSIARV